MIKKKKIYILSKIFFIPFFYFIVCFNISYAKEIYEIKAEKVNYQSKENIIFAEGNATATNEFGEILSADKITYDRKQNIILTFGNSKYLDKLSNSLEAESFKFNINLQLIEANKNVKLIDQEGNRILLTKIIYNKKDKKGYGYNIKASTKDGSYSDASEGEIDQKSKIIILKKSRYTTCENLFNKKNKFCPSWSLVSGEIKHDKKNKKIIHKNSLLKVKNIPILYAPYLSHPDPSVKRQSGFLPPSIKTISNLGRTLKIPYFKVISQDKDITITPTYYFDENSLIQTSYRQATKNGFFKVETGYSQGYKKYNKPGRTKGSRNFIFANYIGNKKNILFEQNDLEFKLQRISQENFVKVNKINTNLFNENISTLENSVRIQSYENNIRLDIKAGIFENLNISNNSKYTYFLPDGVFSYNKLNKNYNLNLNSYFQGKKFNDNEKQGKIQNQLSINSKDYLSNNGIKTKLKFTLFNQNKYNENFGQNKDNLKINNNLSFAMENELPFAKIKENSFQLISPKIFIKHTTGSMQNAFNNIKILNYPDIFTMNRTNSLDAVETGTSLGYGLNYNLSQNIVYDEKIKKIGTSFGIGQVLRDVKENNMPLTSSLNKRSSDFAGFFSFDINDNFLNKEFINTLNLDYKFNIDNNFNNLFRNNLNLNAILNNNQFKITFDEKNNHVGNIRNLTLGYKKIFKNNYSINIENKKNLITDNSEYKRLSINYENDCITTSLSFSKDFYNDKDLQSTKSLIFGITIKPFQENLGPDLTNFIN